MPHVAHSFLVVKGTARLFELISSLVDLPLEGLALKCVFTSHHKLNSVNFSASGLELCNRTALTFIFVEQEIQSQNQQFFIYSLVSVCRSEEFCLSMHVCIHAYGQINIIRVRVHYLILASL